MSQDVGAASGKQFPEERGPGPGNKRLRFTIAYCGTPWRGWQSLPDGRTVQDEMEAAVLKATKVVTRVQGSGRTDAGVHALGQVAHADVPESLRMQRDAWMHGLNACLPTTIRVMDQMEADPLFHARFSSTGKIYRYRIYRPRIISPFEADRAWHVYGPLDMESLHTCARMLVGTHNFARLSANRGDMPEEVRRARVAGTTRTIHRVDVQEAGDVLEIEFEGNGFLFRMVRMMVGSLLQVARGRASVEWFANLLETHLGPQTHQTAPAGGLYLIQALYRPDS